MKFVILPIPQIFVSTLIKINPLSLSSIFIELPKVLGTVVEGFVLDLRSQLLFFVSDEFFGEIFDDFLILEAQIFL